jgi:excisionase family DNA binding protein
VARLLGISRSGAYKLAREGDLPAIRIGPGRVVVPREALERLLAGDGRDTET